MLNKITSYLFKNGSGIFTIFMLIALVAIVTVIYPNKGTSTFEFEVGRPWIYNNLEADFDFAVLKSDESLAAERQEIIQNMPQHYIKIEEQRNTALNKFGQLYGARAAIINANTPGEPEFDSTYNAMLGFRLINQIYDQGVIQLSDNHPENLDHIVLFENNIAIAQSLKGKVSRAEALVQIEAQLKDNNQADKNTLVPIFERVIQPNLVYDDSTMKKIMNEQLSGISSTKGVVRQGQTIVRKGDLVTKNIYQQVLSYQKARAQRVVGISQARVMMIGFLIVTVIMISIFCWYLMLFNYRIFRNIRRLLFLLLLAVGFVAITSTVVRLENPVLMVIPFCITPIIIRAFFGPVLAVYTHLMVCVLVAAMVPNGFDFMFIQLSAGIVAIFANTNARYWSHYFMGCFMIFTTYALAYTGIVLMRHGALMLDPYQYLWILVNVFLTLLAYPLIPFFEKLFGYVSNMTLIELSDLNKPLLKKLSMEAPGTFQHSLQVANLSEAAASEIKANSLLVKVGALYHDIGKMYNAVSFTENQKYGKSLHEDLTPQQSAEVIIKHVTEGVAMAKKEGLPNDLIDFIRTHHGTSRVEYFYRTALQENPDVDPEPFTYPGPRPQTKEAAILMMADSVEAATKSIKEPTQQSIGEMVDKLIKHMMDNQQFDSCNLTFKDIAACKKIFKRLLNNIYHTRIEYPEEA